MKQYAKESEMNITRKGIGRGIGRGIERILFIFFFFCIFTFTFASTFTCCFSYAQPVAIPEGTRCDQCGMAVDRNSKFAAEVINEKGGKMFFCDIGDMLYHFRTSKSA